MTTEQDPVLFSQRGHVATLTLNRPQQLNAWTPAMEALLRREMRRCGADDSVRVIVVTGAGRAFCAGADMSILQAVGQGAGNPFPQDERNDDDFGQRYSYLLSIPKPIICAINGPVVGIGLALALFSDIRYAASSAKLVAAFVRRGLVAEHGIAWMLPRMIGLPRAMEWLLTGRSIDADEAARIGLVNAALPDDGFQEDVARRAAELALNVSPRSARIVKRLVLEAANTSLAHAVHAAEDELAGCLASADFKEGVRHFVEKRAPQFTGR